MEDLRKISKIAALDQKLPGPVCGDPDCEELCAEALEAAISLRLDPMEVLRTIIERELHCIPAEEHSVHACRFGFFPASDSLVLGGEKKKKEDNEVIHIFRTGGNECKDCQTLKDKHITPEIWADAEKMKEEGFRVKENGQYLPHYNCKCHWEERRKIQDGNEQGGTTYQKCCKLLEGLSNIWKNKVPKPPTMKAKIRSLIPEYFLHFQWVNDILIHVPSFGGNWTQYYDVVVKWDD